MRFLLIATLLLLTPYGVFAQTSQMLSVTPPLFQLSVAPGDIWQSSVKVVNANNYPLSVYAEVVNFEAQGENGQGKFKPIVGGTEEDGASLANWIEIAEGPHIIPPEQTTEISFFVDVPKDAAPGGHFAAILISTEPPKEDGGPLAVSTSQAVATLFFARIEGDVIEEATIRELSVHDRSIELPEAHFSLRFENKGNVHLQPRGDIVIFNMWGKERGIIPINNQTHFGNVLPHSIRNFEFSWAGARSITDIGRYKAIATLAYGEDGIKNTSAITYFWVIPVRATLVTIFVIGTFIWLITWMIRLYIRKVLTLAGVDVKTMQYRDEPEKTTQDVVRIASYKKVAKPLQVGARDLRTRLQDVGEITEVVKTIAVFIWNYKVFFASLLLLIAVFVISVLYVMDAAQSKRDYEITITEGDTARKLTDDQVDAVRNE